MKDVARRRCFFVRTCFVALVVSALGGITLAVADDPAQDTDERQADVWIWFDPKGSATVVLSLNFVPPEALETGPLSQMLGCPLQETSSSVEDDHWTFHGHSGPHFYITPLRMGGVLNPLPLVNRLRPLRVQWLTVTLMHPRAPLSRCSPARNEPSAEAGWMRYYYHCRVQPGESAATLLEFEFGYPVRALAKILVPLAVLLMSFVLLTVWMRRAALRSKQTDPAMVWFGYFRHLQWLNIGTGLIWVLAVLGMKACDAACFLLKVSNHAAAFAVVFVVMLLPPTVVIAICYALSQPVFARVRGAEWTRGDLARQSAWGILATMLPLGLMFIAFGAFCDHTPRVGAGLLAAAVVSRVVFLRLLSRARGWKPSALTEGVLRDRVFALAQKAKVKVSQIYVVPAGKGRMANAFAMSGRNVMITDYLLQRLSRREVDAVMAHELGHLQCGHPRKLLLGVMAVILLPMIVAWALGLWIDMECWNPVLPFVAIAGLLGLFYMSRRFERVADARGVALTGDAEAAITSLASLMRLNLLPFHWGKADEGLLTHPSTLRRVRRIAQQAGISDERLQAILAAPPETAAEHYPLPPVVIDGARVFSTDFKNRTALRLAWCSFAMATVPFAAAVWLALPDDDGGFRWGVYAGGLVVGVSFQLVYVNFASLWGYAGLRQRLRQKLEREGLDVEGLGGRFVGLAMGPAPRIYENFYDWDMGWLFFGGDRLCFVGEQTRFALRRDQIQSASLGAGSPGWIHAQRVYVRWRSDDQTTGGTFNLSASGSRSMRQLGQDAHQLEERIRLWLARPADSPALPRELADLKAPDIGDVTSLSPRDCVNGRSTLRAMLICGFIAVGVGVLFGLPFGMSLDHGAGWLVVLSAWLWLFLSFLPYWLYRDPPVPASSVHEA